MYTTRVSSSSSSPSSSSSDYTDQKNVTPKKKLTCPISKRAFLAGTGAFLLLAGYANLTVAVLYGGERRIQLILGSLAPISTGSLFIGRALGYK